MKFKRALLTGGAAAVLLLGSQAAFATSTVTVNGLPTPPADVAFAGTSVGSLTLLTNYGVPASCAGGTISSHIKRGASATSGTLVGAISSLSFMTSCSSTSLNFPITVTHKVDKPAWEIFLDGTPAKGATTINVEIRGVYAQILDSGRMAPHLEYAANVQGNVAGTVGATVKAQLKLNLVGTTDYLVFNTPALGTPSLRTPLVLDALDKSANKANTGNTSTFGGEIQDGDLMSFVGSFALNQQVSIS